MEKYNGQAIVKFDGSNGNAAVGVDVTVINNSTGAAAVLYQDNDTSGTTLANPLTTDSNGRYGFFAQNGNYTISFNSGDPSITVSLFDPNSKASDKFNTLSDAQNGVNIWGYQSDLLNGDIIYISERTAGNGGGAYWRVLLKSSVTVNNFNIVPSIKNTNLAFELMDKSNAEATGAVGDGASDNISFFGFAQSSGLAFEFEPTKTYRTSGTMTITNGSRLNGNGAKLVLGSTNALGTVGTNSYIGGFDVDGEERDHTAAILSIASPSQNAEIGKMTFRNVLGTGDFQTYCVVIPMYGAENFRIGSTKHYNIKHEDNGSVAGRGFVGGVYLVGLDSQVSSGKSYGEVGDVYGEDIKTVEGTGGAPVQDSDLVRSYAETNTTETFDIVFGNITGRDVGKRLVKGASCAGITFGDCFSYVSDIVDGGLPMHATVECLSSAIGWKFGRIGNEGPNTRVVWFQGCTGCEAGDIYNGWGSIAALFGGVAAETTNCKVGDITGRDRPDGDQDGTGVYYYYSDDCATGNIIGDYEWCVRANNSDNTGVNTVGDVNANGKIDLTYGKTVLGKLEIDVRKTNRIERPVVLGDRFQLTNTTIITDGARTVDIVGAIDGDLGNLKIYRVSNSGGINTDVALLTTEGGAVSGRLKGSVYVEVQNAISGSPVINEKTALIYLDGLIGLDLDKLHLNVTTPTRGAVGYNCWVDNCKGYIGNFLVRSSYNATSVIDGDITVDKAANFTFNGILNLTNNVALFFGEKPSTSAINGAVNTPTIVNVTRP